MYVVKGVPSYSYVYNVVYSVYKTDLLPTNYLYAGNVHKGTDEQHDPSQLRKRNKPCGMLLDMYVCMHTCSYANMHAATRS